MRPYLYIFKHGIGPGTIPNDVNVVKVKDLPNYYTAVWLDRFLTTSELKQYDIPSETRINELLDRIGYCQKNGDVVPCSEVSEWDDVIGSTVMASDNMGRDFADVTQEVLDYLADNYPDCDLYNELVNKNISITLWGDEYSLSYPSIKNPDNFLTRPSENDLIAVMNVLFPNSYWGDVVDVDACDNIMASTDIGTGDFTVIQEIYDDGYVYMTEENVEPIYIQEYDVDLADVLTKYPEAEKYALKGWTDETFKPGDIITQSHFAKYVEYTVGDEQMYSDYKNYVSQHPEFNRPCRQIAVRINNPKCLPSAEVERQRQSKELGQRLGKMMGLGRY